MDIEKIKNAYKLDPLNIQTTEEVLHYYKRKGSRNSEIELLLMDGDYDIYQNVMECLAVKYPTEELIYRISHLRGILNEKKLNFQGLGKTQVENYKIKIEFQNFFLEEDAYTHTYLKYGVFDWVINITYKLTNKSESKYLLAFRFPCYTHLTSILQNSLLPILKTICEGIEEGIIQEPKHIFSYLIDNYSVYLNTPNRGDYPVGMLELGISQHLPLEDGVELAKFSPRWKKEGYDQFYVKERNSREQVICGFEVYPFAYLYQYLGRFTNFLRLADGYLEYTTKGYSSYFKSVIVGNHRSCFGYCSEINLHSVSNQPACKIHLQKRKMDTKLFEYLEKNSACLYACEILTLLKIKETECRGRISFFYRDPETDAKVFAGKENDRRFRDTSIFPIKVHIEDRHLNISRILSFTSSDIEDITSRVISAIFRLDSREAMITIFRMLFTEVRFNTASLFRYQELYRQPMGKVFLPGIDPSTDSFLALNTENRQKALLNSIPGAPEERWLKLFRSQEIFDPNWFQQSIRNLDKIY